jgi:enterochelin esterase-like enzyme
MEPNSPALVVILLISAVGLMVAMVRYRHLAIRIACGSLAVTLAVGLGMVIVNDYYGYYQTWTQLNTDLTGNDTTAYPTTAVAASRLPQPGAGRLESVQLPGKLSGINRGGLVYLPPQYFDPKYAHTDFPVVELIHGTPGSPSAWIVHLRVAAIASQLIDQRLTGPMILVIPTMSVGTDFQECVDAPGALDDTYITQDVRTDIEAHFRASTDPAQWGIAGYSSGGYCAANLALRHPASFGAAGIMDGYFRPQDGPAAKALHFMPAAEAANDPLIEAATTGRDGGPLPAFWLSVGTADHGDVTGARAFTAALGNVESVSFNEIGGAGHTFYAWEPAEPFLLQWMWSQLAGPDLRVQFPITGPVRNTSIVLTPAMLAAQAAASRHHKTTHKPVTPVTPVSPAPPTR